MPDDDPAPDDDAPDAPDDGERDDAEPDLWADDEDEDGQDDEPRPPLDVRRHATRLLLGILVCGVVIAVCVVALVVIVDRFTSPAADDCRKVHCGDSLARVAG